MSAYFTRVVRFSAAHRYHRPEWSDERNVATFGACANPHGHGHNYTLEATFVGTPDPDTGFAVNLTEVDAALKAVVVDRLDHQHINHAIEEFAPGRLIPTSENLVAWIWDRLVGKVRSGRLVRLRLYENPDLFVDYFGRASVERPPLRIA
jgi:6-pyruvoyltetrahydropterin/6-carboxytetrahydropterin synthase